MEKRRVLSLRPTQIAIGMEEVKAKAEELGSLGKKKLAKYVKKHPVKVICAPHRELYVIDRHHTLAALWLVGVKKVPVDIEDELSGRNMSRAGFWRLMSNRGCVHLYDQFGEGPREPLYLPEDIRGLSDDPYRSLTWMAKEKGAYGDSDVHYYHFEWAQLLRRHQLLGTDGRSELRRALREAIKICRSPVARDLPGYLGAAAASEGTRRLRATGS